MENFKVIYPDDYTEEDKTEYDNLMILGQGALGTTIPKNQSFLLSIAAKMTIREAKGGLPDLTREEIDALKEQSTMHLKDGFVHQTPNIDWVKSPDNPINQPYMPPEVEQEIKEYDAEYKIRKEVEVAEALKTDWVKLTPSTSNIECVV